MARWNYFDKGDPYSEWHRKENGLRMIDIDTVETDAKTKEPLMIAEHERKRKEIKYKDTTTTQLIANKLNIPGFHILYQTTLSADIIHEKIKCEEDIRLRKEHFKRMTGYDYDTVEEIDMFYIRQISPKINSKFIEVKPKDWYKYLHSLHKELPSSSG